MRGQLGPHRQEQQAREQQPGAAPPFTSGEQPPHRGQHQRARQRHGGDRGGLTVARPQRPQHAGQSQGQRADLQVGVSRIQLQAGAGRIGEQEPPALSEEVPRLASHARLERHPGQRPRAQHPPRPRRPDPPGQPGPRTHGTGGGVPDGPGRRGRGHPPLCSRVAVRLPEPVRRRPRLRGVPSARARPCSHRPAAAQRAAAGKHGGQARTIATPVLHVTAGGGAPWPGAGSTGNHRCSVSPQSRKG